MNDLIRFSKYSATGNDFILIDDRNLQFPAQDVHYIRDLCTRRSGIGADGLILLQPSDRADFKMRYFNADGVESEMCGNGSRSIVDFAMRLGIIKSETTFESMLSQHEGKIVGEKVTVKMNPPRGILERKPVLPNLDYEVGGYVEIGVPHYVLFCPDVDSLYVPRIGASIAHNKIFPKGTNVNFVKIDLNNKIQLRTYERGVEDETLACGTGATASVLFSAKLYGLQSPVEVRVQGGILSLDFDEQLKEFWLSGTVSRIYDGEIHQ